MEDGSVLLRPIAPQDAQALLAFYNGLSAASIRTFRPLGWSTSLKVCQQIADENGMSPGLRYDLVACDGTEIAGWAFIMGLNTDRPELGIAVADGYQGQGIGPALLTRLVGWAREHSLPAIYLIVVQDNQRAINLYQRFGFVTYGEKVDGDDQLPYFQMVAQLQAAG